MRTDKMPAWGNIAVESNFFFRFLGELKMPKRHFEINWPLKVMRKRPKPLIKSWNLSLTTRSPTLIGSLILQIQNQEAVNTVRKNLLKLHTPKFMRGFILEKNHWPARIVIKDLLKQDLWKSRCQFLIHPIQKVRDRFAVAIVRKRLQMQKN